MRRKGLMAGPSGFAGLATLAFCIVAQGFALSCPMSGASEAAGASGKPAAGSRASASAVPEPLFDGLGAVHHAVTTESPLAQRYFDQGLAFAYGFNHDEAGRSFEQAARIDPGMAMAYWGTALVLGPNYNRPGDKERGRHAYQTLEKAAMLAVNAQAVERDLIAALKYRYGRDGEATTQRDQQYADAMRLVAHRYPTDPDVQVLFAESLMDLHPWKLWKADGSPGPDTTEIVATLEAVLKNYPDHIGTNHYYIHAVEASADPGRALASANRLAALAPKAGHLVHMPSHIYVRTGRYHDAAETNRRAIAADREYLSKTSASGFYPVSYYTHNIHFLCYSEMMEGNAKEAGDAARELASIVTPQVVHETPSAEYLFPQSYFVAARFAHWDEILKQPAPPNELAYSTGIWRYVRGRAFAARHHFDQADAELKELDKIKTATPPDSLIGVANSSREVLAVAFAVLSGQIAASRGDHDSAARQLAEAVRLQDALVYDEPPIWYFPVREELGAELLAAGKPAEAEKVYRKDLAINPDNPRSLHGLARCLRAQGRAQAAVEIEQRFAEAWQFSDVKPSQLAIASAVKSEKVKREK